MRLAHANSRLRPDHPGESRQLIEAIAREVWRLHGRDGMLNWIAVESHLSRIVGQARGEARLRTDLPRW